MSSGKSCRSGTGKRLIATVAIGAGPPVLVALNRSGFIKAHLRSYGSELADPLDKGTGFRYLKMLSQRCYRSPAFYKHESIGISASI